MVPIRILGKIRYEKRQLTEFVEQKIHFNTENLELSHTWLYSLLAHCRAYTQNTQSFLRSQEHKLIVRVSYRIYKSMSWLLFSANENQAVMAHCSFKIVLQKQDDKMLMQKIE